MDTPATRMIAAQQMAREITDAEGRRLSLRKLGALEKLRLFKAAGAILAHNQPWLGMALLACSVTTIDDVPVPLPVNEAQIEALVQRLGDAGLAAIGSVFAETRTPVAKDHAKN